MECKCCGHKDFSNFQLQDTRYCFSVLQYHAMIMADCTHCGATYTIIKINYN